MHLCLGIKFVFFARKDIPCGVKNGMLDKILFRQLRFSLFLQYVTLALVLRFFVKILLAFLLILS